MQEPKCEKSAHASASVFYQKCPYIVLEHLDFVTYDRMLERNCYVILCEWILLFLDIKPLQVSRLQYILPLQRKKI